MESARTTTGTGTTRLPGWSGAAVPLTGRPARRRPRVLPAEWAATPLTVVMPTYDEALTLTVVADALLALPLPGLRLLVVDDASPDGTGRLAERLALRHNTPGRPWRMAVLHRPAKTGLGRAYAAGMGRALAEQGGGYVLQMDADGSHPVAAVPELLGVARSLGAGLVVGSRYVPGGVLSTRWGLHRRLLSGCGNRYAQTVLRSRVRDLTGGFNLWSAETLRRLRPATAGSTGYAFQVEIKHRALRAGCRAVEVPITFAERRAGVSKMSFAVQAEAAALPWRLRLRDLREARGPGERSVAPGPADRTVVVRPPSGRR
ncbi:polyprenol monophosphomannose synthase [Streptomyces spiramenti]|uniref:Polyprenol monophosphomannose synthase n=1 Tax=Streptomyces spiramenti TaxID=2720606 RepID=A0ABX1AGB2_9ACTN|nr:polyprenol monophosphomannose synthase [Streptomyces spiramenti]